MIIPAARLYVLLLGGSVFAFSLAAITTNIHLAIELTLIYDLMLLGLTVWDAQQSRTNRLQVYRLPLNKLSIGRENPVTLSLQSKKVPAIVIIKDSCPENFTVTPPFLYKEIKAKTTEDITYTVRPIARGEYAWGKLTIRQLSQWGLVWSQWSLDNATKVSVYPDLIGLRSLSLRITLEGSGSMVSRRRLAQGTEFSELREYSVGDDPRFIDWNASARRSVPIMRVLEAEREQTMIILLDRGRLMTASVKGLQRFDWGLNTTLALAMTGLQRGDRVGVGVFDREIVSWTPPERGQKHLSTLLEKLTPLQPILLESDYFGAIDKLVKQQTRRALVVIITDLIDEIASSSLLIAMARLKTRYLPFCVALRDPEIDNMANMTTTNVISSYNRAVALDLLTGRQVAFAKLKQQGVLVLDAPADQMSEQLVNQYLRLKARNLL